MPCRGLFFLRTVSCHSQAVLKSFSGFSQVILRSFSGCSHVALRALCDYFVRQTEPKILRLVDFGPGRAEQFTFKDFNLNFFLNLTKRHIFRRNSTTNQALF